MPIEITDFISGAFNAMVLSLFAWAAFGEAAYGVFG